MTQSKQAKANYKAFKKQAQKQANKLMPPKRK